MSSSENGPRIVNSVGKVHFGKWFLYSTAIKTDTWKKPVVDAVGTTIPDNYIRIVRDNTQEEHTYMIFFHGDSRFLIEHFKNFMPEYEDHASRLKFEDIQAAKDFVDKFIERMNNLIAFI